MALGLLNGAPRQGLHVAVDFDGSKLEFSEATATERVVDPLRPRQNVATATDRLHLVILDETAARTGIAAGEGPLVRLSFFVPATATEGVHLQQSNVALAGALAVDSELQAVPITQVNYVGIRLAEYRLEEFSARRGGEGRVEVMWTCRGEDGGRNSPIRLYRSTPTSPAAMVQIASYPRPAETGLFLDAPPPADEGTSGAPIRYHLAVADARTGVAAVLGMVVLDGSESEQVVGLHEAALRDASPNPFSKSTSIEYRIPTRGHASLRIYSVDGRLVRTMRDGVVDASVYQVTWDGQNEKGKDVASGIYFLRLVTSGYSATKKVVLLR